MATTHYSFCMNPLMDVFGASAFWNDHGHNLLEVFNYRQQNSISRSFPLLVLCLSLSSRCQILNVPIEGNPSSVKLTDALFFAPQLNSSPS